MSLLPLVIDVIAELAINAVGLIGINKNDAPNNGDKNGRKESRAIKREEKSARLDRVIQEANAWELAISHVIEAKAEGFTPPEWAVATIREDPDTATAILFECQKSAIKSHIVKDVDAEGYDARLANHSVQHLTIHSQKSVENRLDFLADVFRARTCDHQYRKTLIRSVVSYSVHKSKALEKKYSAKA